MRHATKMSYKTRSKILHERGVKALIAISALLVIVMLSRHVHAFECASPVVLSCEDAEDLRKAAIRGLGYDTQRQIAEDAEARLNIALGRLLEAQERSAELSVDNIKLSVEVDKRHSTRAIVGWAAAAFILGGTIGALSF